MTFEKALIKLKQGKKISRAKGTYAELRGKSIWCVNSLTGDEDPIDLLQIDAVLADDWEIYGEENQTNESGVSIKDFYAK